MFLFEQLLLMAEGVERKRGPISTCTYLYKNSVKVNKIGLVEESDWASSVSAGQAQTQVTHRFVIVDKTPGSTIRYVFEAPSSDSRENWIAQIKDLLAMQGDFLRGLIFHL